MVDAVSSGSTSGAPAVVKVTDTDGNKANALAVVVVGTDGIAAPAAGGTQYTEDDAAAANPVGNAMIFVRRDTLSTGEVSADGDNVAAKATNKGELYTKDTDVAARLPTALAAGGGLKIEGVAGGVAQPVSGPQTNAEFIAALKSTATHSSVNSGTSSVTILASNASRKGARIFNTDANNLFLDLSGGTAAATTRAQVVLAQNTGYDVPFGCTGTITGIWSADGTGVASVVEFA
jgi:hypothetical protein